MLEPDRTPPDGARSPYAEKPWLASYPPGVPADYDFPKVPVTRLLDDAAASFPTRTALAFLGQQLTYHDLRDETDHLAAGLAALGVRKGDRVSVVLPNCPQAVLAVFAVLRLGAVVVQHDPSSTERELRAQLADCGSQVVVCLDTSHDTVSRLRSVTAVRHVVVTSLLDHASRRTRLSARLPLPGTRAVSSPVHAHEGTRQLSALLRTPAAARQTPVDPEHDLALLQYTGGTTGTGRAAMLSHDNLVSNAYMNRLWDAGATAGQEVTICVLPLFHAYGFTVCLSATVLLAGTLVLLPRFDLDELFRAVDRYRPTLLPGVPPIYRAIADSAQVRLHDLSSLRACVSGAMPLPVDVQEDFERRSGAVLVEGYGLTEAAPCTHCNPLSAGRRPGSIGLPLPGTECKLVEVEDPSQEVPVGASGELLVRGPQVFRGYWGSDDHAGVLTADGWLLTGDIAVMDADGFFSVVARKKDIIVSGGYNISPAEVEQALAAHPGVADVVVAGIPDRYRGEIVKAYVVPVQGSGLTEADVLAHCARELVGYKVPKAVELREALPRTAVGKVLRRELVAEELRKTTPPPGRSQWT